MMQQFIITTELMANDGCGMRMIYADGLKLLWQIHDRMRVNLIIGFFLQKVRIPVLKVE